MASRQVNTAILTLTMMMGLAALPTVLAASPAIDCGRIGENEIENLICGDNALIELDRKLAGVYEQAKSKTAAQPVSFLRASQVGWIKGRNECWKAPDKRQCVEDSYVRRIAELQAQYGLVRNRGPVTYKCEDGAKEVIAVFYSTEPPTLVAKHDNRVSLMYKIPSASGTKYAGPNESLWEDRNEASITWGYSSPEMKCAVN